MLKFVGEKKDKMPRVGLQLADELHKLSEALGHPGIKPLWIAVKRRKLAVSKKQVTEYVRDKAVGCRT